MPFYLVKLYKGESTPLKQRLIFAPDGRLSDEINVLTIVCLLKGKGN